jgi:phage FluMu protein Com
MTMRTVKCVHCGKAMPPDQIFVHTQYQCPKRPKGVGK